MHIETERNEKRMEEQAYELERLEGKSSRMKRYIPNKALPTHSTRSLGSIVSGLCIVKNRPVNHKANIYAHVHSCAADSHNGAVVISGFVTFTGLYIHPLTSLQQGSLFQGHEAVGKGV